MKISCEDNVMIIMSGSENASNPCEHNHETSYATFLETILFT